MPSKSKQFFDTVFDYDASSTTYNNRTIEAMSVIGTSFTCLGATADYLYLGSDDRFDMAVFDIDAAGDLGALTWEYYNGSTWAEFHPASDQFAIDPDGDDFGLTYKFDKDGVEVFPPSRLADWTTETINSANRYWIRVRSASSVSTAPTVRRIQMRPVAAYCTSQDVFEFLQLSTVNGGTDFTASTVPTKAQVEDRIMAAQSKIEYLSRKSFRPVIVTNEGHHFNLMGFKLDKSDPYKMLKHEVWDGGSWQARTEGRDNDYFLVPEIGMIYYARYFVLPARFQNYNSPIWAYGGGEFSFSIRVSYLAGLNIHTDPEGPAAYDATVKWVASDLISNFDFGTFLVSGGNANISGGEKVTQWKQEAEDWAESLRQWESF